MQLNEGRKRPLSKDDIFNTEIELNHLKRIDKIFMKGIHFYLDPKSPEITKDASIFFRKTKFGTKPNIGAKKIVNHFEELKISLSAISKLAEISTDRVLPVYNTKQDPKSVAAQIREKLYPEFNPFPREFLKSLIKSFADSNIMVFEFIETWNKREKANLDGFFLQPNVIVIKRIQTSLRREIFTLVHELAHYLINEEEVEQFEEINLADRDISAIERWSNDFAFYFLLGEYSSEFDIIVKADAQNDYHFDIIEKISSETHLNQLALFTRLLFDGKISRSNYNKIKNEFEERFKRKLAKEREKAEAEKALGIKSKGAVPKPINSPLLISTLQAAYIEGIVNESEFCKILKITPEKFEKYLV